MTIYAGVVELADALDSKSSGLIIRAGSTPATGTKNQNQPLGWFCFLLLIVNPHAKMRSILYAIGNEGRGAVRLCQSQVRCSTPATGTSGESPQTITHFLWCVIFVLYPRLGSKLFLTMLRQNQQLGWFCFLLLIMMNTHIIILRVPPSAEQIVRLCFAASGVVLQNEWQVTCSLKPSPTCLREYEFADF